MRKWKIVVSVIVMFACSNRAFTQENVNTPQIVLDGISVEENRKLLPVETVVPYPRVTKTDKIKANDLIRRISIYPFVIYNTDYSFEESTIEVEQTSYVFKVAPQIIDFEIEGMNSFASISWFTSRSGSSTSATYLYKVNSFWSIGVSASVDKYTLSVDRYLDQTLYYSRFYDERTSQISLVSRFSFKVDNLQHNLLFQIGKASAESSDVIDDFDDDSYDSTEEEEYSFVPLMLKYDIQYRSGNTLFGVGASIGTGFSYDNKHNKALERSQFTYSIYPSITFEF